MDHACDINMIENNVSDAPVNVHTDPVVEKAVIIHNQTILTCKAEKTQTLVMSGYSSFHLDRCARGHTKRT